MPEDIARRLGSYDDCNTPREADRWITETVDWLIQRTAATEPETDTWPRPAVPCPLCGGSSLHLYHDGFRRVAEDNVIAWIDDRDNRIVYADPRAQGKITFEVWRTPLPKPGSYPRPSGTFYLLDRYHIKLAEKYAKRVGDAIKD